MKPALATPTATRPAERSGVWLRCWAPAVASLGVLAACAQPATEVQVATMSMHEALEKARGPALGANPAAPTALQIPPPPPPIPRGTPQGLLSAPPVRLAYLYEWIDADGNKHFGEWIAIPLAGFDWIMNDGSRAPLDAGQGPATQEAR